MTTIKRTLVCFITEGTDSVGRLAHLFAHQWSTPFEIEPLPMDQWRFLVKAEVWQYPEFREAVRPYLTETCTPRMIHQSLTETSGLAALL